jgi:hypothetical protein
MWITNGLHLEKLRTGTSPVGGAAGCSAHTLGSRLTRRRFSSSEFISEKIPSPVKSGFGGLLSRYVTFFS